MASRPNLAIGIGVQLVVLGLVGAGCRTGRVDQVLVPEMLAEAAEVLGRPLSGDMGALYELTIPASGGLRLSLLQLGPAGRITVSEPFGAAVSMVDWSASGRSTLLDFRKGCYLEDSDLVRLLGVDALPLSNAVRLLGGRLPAVDGDRVIVRPDGRLGVSGSGWSAVVTVAAEPWRVTLVEESIGRQSNGWSFRLKDHSGSVPGWIRVDDGDRRWAELELVRLQWDTVVELPGLPSMPMCGAESGE